MPGGGLYSLVAYGAQNVLLSGNPDFTYFYKSYRKYSHFAEESMTFSMDGPQDLSYDQPIQIRLKLQRVADLIRDVYFVCQLPDIFCKYIDLPNGNRQSQYNFSWAEYIGCHLIQTVGFYIGGQRIQEFEGAYLIAKAQCDLDPFSYEKWKRLVGHVPELYDPSNGVDAGISSTGAKGYPLVYNYNGPGQSTIQPPNVNRPSIQGRQLQVPIPFWFTESTFKALPLISLQSQECEIRFTLRPIQYLYRILDINGFSVAPGYQYHPSPVDIQPENVYYTALSDISDVTIQNFLTDIGTPVPLLNTWSLQPRIQMTYVYVTDEERTQFASEPLQYMVRQITPYRFQLSSRQFVMLDTHNPIERIIVLPRRTDSMYRNQTVNFTNWKDPKQPPFLPPTGWPSTAYTTGRLVLNGQAAILSGLTVLGDGNPLQEDKSFNYFTQVFPWKYLTGIPESGMIVYPFSLSSPNTQPQGSINSSRIKTFQLDLNVYPLPSNSFYQYDITIYVESLNWVNVASGMGGLKYAL